MSVTVDKKGLGVCVSRVQNESCRELTYKRPVNVLSVEMDDELKAGHCEDCDSEMQLCADAPCSVLASIPSARKCRPSSLRLALRGR